MPGYDLNFFEAWDDLNSEDVDSLGNNLSKEQVDFFKNSKVRDAQGKLLVCSHSSNNNNITSFNKDKFGTNEGSVWGNGFYFYNHPDNKAFGKYSYNCYLNITNPAPNNVEGYIKMLITEYPETDIEDYLRFRTDNLYEYRETELIEKYIEQMFGDKITFTELCMKCGFDGRIIKPVIIVFNSNQIKLVDNKNPSSSDRLDEDENTIKDTVIIGSTSELLEKIKTGKVNYDELTKFILTFKEGTTTNKTEITTIKYILKIIKNIKLDGQANSLTNTLPNMIIAHYSEIAAQAWFDNKEKGMSCTLADSTHDTLHYGLGTSAADLVVTFTGANGKEKTFKVDVKTPKQTKDIEDTATIARTYSAPQHMHDARILVTISNKGEGFVTIPYIEDFFKFWFALTGENFTEAKQKIAERKLENFSEKANWAVSKFDKKLTFENFIPTINTCCKNMQKSLEELEQTQTNETQTKLTKFQIRGKIDNSVDNLEFDDIEIAKMNPNDKKIVVDNFNVWAEKNKDKSIKKFLIDRASKSSSTLGALSRLIPGNVNLFEKDNLISTMNATKDSTKKIANKIIDTVKNIIDEDKNINNTTTTDNKETNDTTTTIQ